MSVLVCHGYEVFANQVPSKLLVSLCRRVAQVSVTYDTIFLLGGQHLKEQGSVTVDQVMKRMLQNLGVPEAKLVAWSEVCPEQRPPRDTMEEIDLLPYLFSAHFAVKQPQQIVFDSACIWYFRFRVRFLCWQRRARCRRIYGASSANIARMIIEVIALVATIVSPTGQSFIFRRNRAARNVFPAQHNGQSWKDNLPAAWRNYVLF